MPPSRRSTGPSSSARGASTSRTSSPRCWTRRSPSPRAAAPGPCSSTCRWTCSRPRSTSRCSTRCSATPARSRSPASTKRSPSGSCRTCSTPTGRCSTSAAGIVAADAASELEEFAELLSLPVAHSLMGKGALPDDSPLVLGMTGFWGTAFVNETTRTADWILALGTRFAEADSSSWYAEYTFDIPATKLMQIDIDPAELGRNYPLEIGALADLKSALTVLIRVARRLAPRGCSATSCSRRSPRTARPEAPERGRPGVRRVADAARADPLRDPGGAARRCDHHDGRGLEQERRGSAVRHPHPRHVPHAGRLRDHGLRRARPPSAPRSPTRIASSSHSSATAASGRTRRCSPPRGKRTSPSSGSS